MRYQNRLPCLAILLFSAMPWGETNSEIRGSKNDVEIAKVEREYLAAKSYYKTLLQRTEALEQTINEVRERRTSLESLKKSGKQIAILIHQIEQLNEDLGSFYTRTKVASSEVKVTEEAQVSTPKETPVSPRTDPLVSNRNKVYETPSTNHRNDAANLAKKDYFSDFIRTESDTESDTESEKERLKVLKAYFNDNFYLLWTTKLLEHIDYYLAPHLEAVEQDIIKGSLNEAERRRNRDIFPNEIKSLDDLDPNCAVHILDTIQIRTLDPKDVEMMLRGPGKRNWYPFKPLFNESNGDISYERLRDRDGQFTTDIVNLWMREMRQFFDIAYPDNGTVPCSNCTLLLMGGWTEAGLMSASRFWKIRDFADELCPENFKQQSNEDDEVHLFDI